MEMFVKMLYDRLETKKDLQLQLFVIMQNAINEMHNSGIIASLTGDAAAAVHHSDPNVRIDEKTKLAKAVAKSMIPTTLPVPSPEGLSYQATLNYDPRFVNSITLCFQGGIEGLRVAFSSMQTRKLDKYIIQVNAGGHDLTALLNNLQLLDRMYEEISIQVVSNGVVLYPTKAAPKAPEKPAAPKEEKKGFFARLFGKK